MKKYKPSELPIGTTINDADDVYTKSVIYDGRVFWVPDHCEDCVGDLSIPEDRADDEFKNFEVVAWPSGVVEYILNEFVIHDDQMLLDAINYIKEKTDEEV
jgi:hypothetical protein